MEDIVAFIFAGLWGIAIFVLLIVNLIPECKAKIDNSDLAKKTSKKYLIISLIMTAVGILVFIFFKSKIQEYSGLFLLSVGFTYFIDGVNSRFTNTPINKRLHKTEDGENT